MSSYAPVPEDTGLHIRAYVTASNSGGSATAYTYPTAKITGGSLTRRRSVLSARTGCFVRGLRVRFSRKGSDGSGSAI